MRTVRRSSGLIVFALVLFLGMGAAYGATKFPEKPITFVVHSGVGSSIDILCRLIAAGNDKHRFFPQPLVVENKPGGSAAVAMAYVAGKKKDPYFLLTIAPPFLMTPLLGQSPVNYKEFTPICNISYEDNMLLVNSNSKYKSVMDLIADAKANPNKVTVGIPNMSGPGAVNTYLLEKTAGIKLKYVGMGGGGDLLTNLLGGHIDLSISQPSESLELIRANKVRVLGVLAEKRLPGAPEFPTVKEQGLNTAGMGMNRGLVGPGGIPEEARKILEGGFFKYMQTEENKKYHSDNFITEKWMDGPTLGKWLDEQNELNAAALKEMGLIKK